jgi:predicted ATPase
MWYISYDSYQLHGSQDEYSTLVQAFQSLVWLLLGKSDTELAVWRSAFLEALDPS